MNTLPPRTECHSLPLVRDGAVFASAISMSECPEPALRSLCAQVLHDDEFSLLNSDRLGRWWAGYLRGRLCAKLALKEICGGFDYREVLVQRGVFSQPVVRGKGLSNVAVSISHSGDRAAAVAFDEAHPMGIDIEVYTDDRQEVIRRNMSMHERDAMASTDIFPAMQLTLMWTIKESLSKVIRTGMMSPLGLYEIEAVETQDGVVVSTFRNFAQYKSLSLVLGDTGLSVTLPRHSTADLQDCFKASIFRPGSRR